MSDHIPINCEATCVGGVDVDGDGGEDVCGGVHADVGGDVSRVNGGGVDVEGVDVGGTGVSVVDVGFPHKLNPDPCIAAELLS